MVRRFHKAGYKICYLTVCGIFGNQRCVSPPGISHMTWGGHHYFLSWREPWHKFEDWDWFNGRNFCRDRCMDLVSFDTPGEYALFAAIMKKGEERSTVRHGT